METCFWCLFSINIPMAAMKLSITQSSTKAYATDWEQSLNWNASHRLLWLTHNRKINRAHIGAFVRPDTQICCKVQTKHHRASLERIIAHPPSQSPTECKNKSNNSSCQLLMALTNGQSSHCLVLKNASMQRHNSCPSWSITK